MTALSSSSVGSVCIKYFLHFFNLFVVLSGVIIIAVGITIKAYSYEELIFDGQSFSPPNFFIAIGSIIFIIAFFGCCGALKENFCMTVTFSTLLILIFVLEFAAGISGYVLKNQTNEFLTEKLNESLHKYNSSEINKYIQLWNVIQTEFHCCGVHNYTDWDGVTTGLPRSCCGPQPRQVGTVSCNKDTASLYPIGCVEGFGNVIKENAVTIASVGFGLAFVQFLGIIFSCHLSRQIKRNYETV